ERVGACLWFGERISGDEFGGGKPRQVAALLLFGSEEHQRERADAGVRSMPGGVRGVAGKFSGGDHGACQVKAEAAVSFRDLDSGEPQLGGLAKQSGRDARLLML